MDSKGRVWTLVLLFSMTFLCAPGQTIFAAKGSKQHSARESANSLQPIDFTLKDTDGSSHQLFANKGKRAVMLYFWTTSCPHCRKAEPKIAAMREKYSADALQILAINCGDSEERTRRYREARKLPYVVLLDSEGTVAGKYGIIGVPSFVLISREGKVVYANFALPEEQELKSLLALAPALDATGHQHRSGAAAVINRLFDDALEQILEKAEMDYSPMSESIYLLPEIGIVLGNKSESLEAAYLLFSRDVSQARIDEWNQTKGNEAAKAFASGIIASVDARFDLTAGVTEANVLEFIKTAGTLAKKFNAFLQQKPATASAGKGRQDEPGSAAAGQHPGANPAMLTRDDGVGA